jgi:DNA topoisomerase I
MLAFPPIEAGRPAESPSCTHMETQSALGRLHQVSPDNFGIFRKRRGRGFFYFDESDKRITSTKTLNRIRSLAIPPAYTDVRISNDAMSLLQAVGRDAAGRLQYRYHPQWPQTRESRKANRISALSKAIPRIRRKVARDLARDGVERERVMAAVVAVIDETHIRIGCDDYVHSGRSRGAATLLKQNATATRNGLRLCFRGKGGHQIETLVRSRALRKLYPHLLKLQGRRLFQYRDEAMEIRKVTSRLVNAYLAEAAGIPVTAKDFRTLAGTALAAEMLSRVKPASSKRARRSQIGEVMQRVAEDLCNTPAVVKKSYVHARLINAFEKKKLGKAGKPARTRNLSRGEAIVADLFKAG